jgi:uridine kinase
MEALLMSKIKSVIKRNGTQVDFNQLRINNAIYRAAVSVGGRDYEQAKKLGAQVTAILEEKYAPDQIPNVEDIQDVIEKVLIENGHAQVAKHYILYREERTRIRERANRERNQHDSGNIPWEKIWRALDWAVDHNLNHIEGLNQRVAAGEMQEIVMESEVVYRQDIEQIAEQVLARQDEIRIVIVAGPSSSGKTTTTKILNEKLRRSGFQLKELGLDNYFYDLEMHPKDEFGDYDFETPQAMDLELINTQVNQMLKGETVLIPHYDFKLGKRTLAQTEMHFEPNEMILIDSLFGLYPEMLSGVEDSVKMKIYIEPLLQMKTNQGKYVRWTDIRLMRRMLRDSIHRAYDYERTLTHWHYVRSSERRNIIPYMQYADYVINSAMPYELSIYTPKLIDSFRLWVQKYADDPLREDAYTRAERVLGLLEQVLPYPDDSVVPEHSVIREFIGGSIYD